MGNKEVHFKSQFFLIWLILSNLLAVGFHVGNCAGSNFVSIFDGICVSKIVSRFHNKIVSFCFSEISVGWDRLKTALRPPSTIYNERQDIPLLINLHFPFLKMIHHLSKKTSSYFVPRPLKSFEESARTI